MPPITTARPIKALATLTQDVPKGDPRPALPALAPRFREAGVTTANANFDRFRWNFEDSASILALMTAPVAIAAANGQLLDRTGSIRRQFVATPDEILPDSYEVLVATGVVATYIGRGIWDLSIDPDFERLSPNNQAYFATFQVRARAKLRSTEYITWPPLSIETRGGAVVVQTGPRVVGQPAPRTFVEGAITEFSENIASFFTGGTPPFTYDVLNGDGSPLTDFVLDEIVVVSPTEVIAYITSPACEGDVGVYPLRYQITDAGGMTASVIQLNNVTVDPLPRVVSNPAPRSIPRNQSGAIALTISDYLTDDQPLTVSVDLGADGHGSPIPLPIGYSFNVTADLLTINYPTEGVAVTRNLRILGIEQGALLREVSVILVVDRPNTATVIGNANPVTVAENAITEFIVDVSAFIAGAASYGVRGRGNTQLPAQFTVLDELNGVLTIEANIPNNDIQTFLVEYFGDAVVVNSEWRSVHNAPVPGVINVDAVNVLPMTIDVLAASDDPAVNRIVAGSVTTSEGTASIVGTRIVVSAPNFVGTASVNYTLEAGAGGATTAGVLTINWRALDQAQPGPRLDITATVGLPVASVNVAALFIPGTFPIDATSLQFTDNQGTLLGKAVTIANVGTFTIDNAGVMTTTSRGDLLGAFPLYVAANDTEGFGTEDGLAQQINYTQIANPSAPPPAGLIEPNTDDGKPILQLGLQEPLDFTGEYLWASRHQKLLWHISDFDIDDLTIAGEYDPQTGYFTLPAGRQQRFRFLRPDIDNSRVSHPEIDAGQWVIKYTLDPAVSPNTGTITVVGYTLTESGSTGNQKRFVLTTTDTDSGARNVLLNAGVSGCKLRIDYIGPATREALNDGFHPDFVAYCYDYKILRNMNLVGVISSKATRDSDWVPDDWYSPGGNLAGLPTVIPTTNRDKLRKGFKYKTFFELCYQSQSAAWICLPHALGAGVIEAAVWSTGAAGTFSAIIPQIVANFDAISSGIDTEFFAHGVRVANSLAAADYPTYRVLICEIGNEIWNTGAAGVAGNRYCQGLGQAIQAVDEPTRNREAGQGYLTARGLRAFFAGVRSVRPTQELVGMLTFSGNQGGSENVMQAFIDEANRVPGISPQDVFISVTNYYSGAFKWQNARSPETGNPFYSAATTHAEFVALWAAEHAADEAAFFQKLENFFLDPLTARNSNGYTDTIYGVRERFLTFLQRSLAFGFRGLIPYEGGNHDNGDGALGILTSYPDARGAAARFNASIHGKRITERLIENLLPIKATADNITTGWRPQNMIVSNYYDSGPDNPDGRISGPWIDRIVGRLRGPYEGQAQGWQTYFRGNGTSAAPLPPPTGGGGGGGGGGGSQPLFDRTIVSTDSIQILQSEGWGPAGVSHVVIQEPVSGEWSLRSPNEGGAMFKVFRQTLQADANLTFRFRWKPDNTVRSDFLRLERGANIISVRPQINLADNSVTGELTVSLFGQPDVPALVTTGANIFAGGFIDMEIDYFIDASSGIIRVRINGTQRGIFNGDTNPLAVQNPYIDRFRIRGRSYFSRFEDKTA